MFIVIFLSDIVSIDAVGGLKAVRQAFRNVDSLSPSTQTACAPG
jgi:hypothetical protein